MLITDCNELGKIVMNLVDEVKKLSQENVALQSAKKKMSPLFISILIDPYTV